MGAASTGSPLLPDRFLRLPVCEETAGVPKALVLGSVLFCRLALFSRCVWVRDDTSGSWVCEGLVCVYVCVC